MLHTGNHLQATFVAVQAIENLLKFALSNLNILKPQLCSEAPSRIVERSEGSRFQTGKKRTKVRLRGTDAVNQDL